MQKEHVDQLTDFLSELPSAQANSLMALRQEMMANGNAKDDPTRELMALLGDKWSNLILLILASGELGHARLKRAIELLSFETAISQRVLTLKLRSLERNGIVSRTISDDVPPSVTYALTEIGLDLTNHSSELVRWIASNNKKILNARASFHHQEKRSIS